MDRIDRLALKILAEETLETEGKDILSFDMTEDEWKRYKRDHPGAKPWNHHIIHTPKRGTMTYNEWEQEKIKAKKKYFADMKKKHPNYVPIVDKESMDNLLRNGEYSCISAGLNGNDPKENKMMKNLKSPAVQDFIQKRTEQLKSDLDALGVQYTEIAGSYANSEEPSFLISHTLKAKANIDDDSFLVVGNKTPSRNDLIRKLNALGTKYNQDSVSHVKNGQMEWHYTTGENKGKKGVGRANGTKKTKDSGTYSEARLGDEDYTKWTCNMDRLFDSKGNLIKQRLVDNPLI